MPDHDPAEVRTTADTLGLSMREGAYSERDLAGIGRAVKITAFAPCSPRFESGGRTMQQLHPGDASGWSVSRRAQPSQREGHRETRSTRNLRSCAVGIVVTAVRLPQACLPICLPTTPRTPVAQRASTYLPQAPVARATALGRLWHGSSQPALPDLTAAVTATQPKLGRLQRSQAAQSEA